MVAGVRIRVGECMQWWMWLIWLALAYLCGSIPFAVLIGRWRGVDIRKHGSGNPGASNLGRAVGRKWGLLCFFLDVLKGLLPTLAFGLLYLDLAAAGDGAALTPGLSLQWVAVGLAAVLGHVFSLWLGFRGGKGVATGLGAALGLFPVVTAPGFIALGIWYVVCKTSGYVGLASVVAAASLPLLTIASCLMLGMRVGEIAIFFGLTGALAALVIWRHRGNLSRLRAGTEPKAAWTRRADPTS